MISKHLNINSNHFVHAKNFNKNVHLYRLFLKYMMMTRLLDIQE